jgi:hypothetical protein
MMDDTFVKNQKSKGSKLITDISALISVLNNYSVPWFYFGKKETAFKTLITKYSNLVSDVLEYNKSLDDNILTGHINYSPQIQAIPLFDFQRKQIQELINISFSILSGKELKLRYTITLELTSLAILISFFSVLYSCFFK